MRSAPEPCVLLQEAVVPVASAHTCSFAPAAFVTASARCSACCRCCLPGVGPRPARCSSVSVVAITILGPARSRRSIRSSWCISYMRWMRTAATMMATWSREWRRRAEFCGRRRSALACVRGIYGRLPGFAGAGPLQVRASALIPCGDGLRPPSGPLTQGPAAPRTSSSTAINQTCKTTSRLAGEGARRAAVLGSLRRVLLRGCRLS